MFNKIYCFVRKGAYGFYFSHLSSGNDRKGTVAHRCAQFATRSAIYDAIKLRVSQLISSVTKSRSGHEFSRAPVSRNTVRACGNFWFRFSGLWPHRHLVRYNGGIFSGGGGGAIAPIFKKERPKIHYSRARLARISFMHNRRTLIYVEGLGIIAPLLCISRTLMGGMFTGNCYLTLNLISEIYREWLNSTKYFSRGNILKLSIQKI